MNPTSEQLFGLSPADLALLITSLGLPPTADARMASYRIISHLALKLNELTDGAGELVTYRIAKVVNNFDLDTQIQTFTFNYRLALIASALEDES